MLKPGIQKKGNLSLSLLKSLGSSLGERSTFILLVILLTALVLRGVFLSQIPLSSGLLEFRPPGSDMKTYYDWAMRIASGDWLGDGVFYYNPLYPYLLGLLFTLFGTNLGIVAFVQILLGLISLLLIYFIGKEVFSETVGLLAALMGAFYSMFIIYEQVLLPDSLGVFLSLLTIYPLVRFHDNPKASYAFIAGAFMGLSVLNRSIFLALVPFIGGWILLNKGTQGGRKTWFLGVFLLAMGLIIAPVSIRNFIVGRDLVLITSNGGVNFFIGNSQNSKGWFHYPPPYQEINKRISSQNLKPSQVSRLWFHEALRSIGQDPMGHFRLLLRKLSLFWGRWEVPNNIDYLLVKRHSSIMRAPLLSFGLLAPLGLTGALLSINRRGKAFLLHLFVLVYSLLVVAFFVVGRFRLPVVPFLLVFGAFTFLFWYEKVKEGAYIQVALSLLLFFAFWMVVNLQPIYTHLGV